MFKKRSQKLASTTTTFIFIFIASIKASLVTKNLQYTLYLHYLIWISWQLIQTLINSRNEINAMPPSFIEELKL